MRFGAISALALLLCGAAQAADISAVPLKNDGEGAIIVSGDLNYEDREVFLTKIAPFKSGLVVFDSKGGNAYAGIEIGKAIRMRNFTTWVASGSVCASACAMAWLGGTRRLMGKGALIGFHSVYRFQGGAPVETGSGNAIYGAYLAQLGLSERAIFYLSSAAPASMNWLTPVEAEGLGITVAIYDPAPTSGRPSARPNDNAVSSLEARSKDFVVALNVILSGPTEQYLKILNDIYSEQVSYFGKLLPRGDVVNQLTKFIARWPVRNYAVKPESVKVQCNEQTQECHIDGMIDFDAKSQERGQHSHGVATFDYLLSYRPGARWPVIVSENGSIVNRKLEALVPPSPPYPLNFGAAR